MKRTHWAVIVGLAGAVFSPAASFAAEPEQVVVRNRQYVTDGTFEASLNVGMAIATFLTEHTTFTGGIAYNLSEEFALELGGGFALGSHSDVADSIAEKNASDASRLTTLPEINDFEDLWQMTWSATGLVRWSPFYGKVNIAGELPVHFKFYLVAGGGVSGLERDSIIYCLGNPAAGRNCVADGGGNNQTAMHQEEVKPIGIGGLGLRLFVAKDVAVNLEFRDTFFQDSYRIKAAAKDVWNDASAPSGNPKAGVEAGSPGLSHIATIQLGATYTF